MDDHFTAPDAAADSSMILHIIIILQKREIKIFTFVIKYFNSQTTKMRLQNQEGINFADVEFFKNFKEKHHSGHKKCPNALAWNPNGQMLVTAQNSIKSWHFSEENGLQKGSDIKGHESSVDYAEFGTSQLLGTLSRDSIRFWDVRQNGKMSSNRIQKKNKYDFIRFCWNNVSSSGQGLQFALINKDNSVTVYDFKNLSAPLTTIPSKSGECLAVAWDKSNSVLFLAGGESNSGSFSLYHGSTFESLSDPMITHCSRITDICFAPNNQKFVTSSQDSMVELHNIPDLICERVFSNKSDNSFKRVSMNYDGRYLAASSDSNCIDIFNAEKGGTAWKVKCSTSQEALAWHPSKMVLAYIDEEDKRRSLDRGDQSYIHLLYQ